MKHNRYFGAYVKARIGDPVKVLLGEIKKYQSSRGGGRLSESDIVRIAIVRYGRDLLGDRADYILSRGVKKNG